MSSAQRWERCVCLRGEEVACLIDSHFSEAQRHVLLIAGAGFDPRATTVAQQLSSRLRERLSGLYLREKRPDPDPELVRRAEANLAALVDLTPTYQLVDIEVFASDGPSSEDAGP